MRLIRTVHIESKLLREPSALRKELEKVVADTAFDIERRIKEKMREPKHGRVYPRGPILRAATRKTRALGLREREVEVFVKGSRLLKQKKRKAIVGFRFHRASAPGEAPAVDYGPLINSVKASPRGLRATISSSKFYAAILEYFMNRPAFEPALEEMRVPFNRRIDAAIARLI